MGWYALVPLPGHTHLLFASISMLGNYGASTLFDGKFIPAISISWLIYYNTQIIRASKNFVPSTFRRLLHIFAYIIGLT